MSSSDAPLMHHGETVVDPLEIVQTPIKNEARW